MHGCARTTPEIRAAIQSSAESVRTLARRYGVNPKTVLKWRRRMSVADAPMGPKVRRSTVLTPAEEAMCVGFRKHAHLPLDDCLYALQPRIPHLTRSSLHRLYRRHGISRLPATAARTHSGEHPNTGRIGGFYIDTSPVRTGDGRHHIFIAFDRVSRFAFAELHDGPTRGTAAKFLANLIAAVPYRVHSVLTSDVAEFADAQARDRAHPFAVACRANGIAHDLIPSGDPWTIGRPAANMPTPPRRRPERSYYADRAHLREHFFAFFDTYNFTRRLKTLSGRTPYEFICDIWEREPGRFRVCPVDRLPRLTAGSRNA